VDPSWVAETSEAVPEAQRSGICEVSVKDTRAYKRKTPWDGKSLFEAFVGEAMGVELEKIINDKVLKRRL
jgi:hypothetical protein